MQSISVCSFVLCLPQAFPVYFGLTRVARAAASMNASTNIVFAESPKAFFIRSFLTNRRFLLEFFDFVLFYCHVSFASAFSSKPFHLFRLLAGFSNDSPVASGAGGYRRMTSELASNDLEIACKLFCQLCVCGQCTCSLEGLSGARCWFGKSRVSFFIDCCCIWSFQIPDRKSQSTHLSQLSLMSSDFEFWSC